MASSGLQLGQTGQQQTLTSLATGGLGGGLGLGQTAISTGGMQLGQVTQGKGM